MPRLIAALVFVCGAASAVASPVTGVLPDAELRGAATFRYFGVALYDARLYTRKGAPLDWSSDFGLEFTYRKNLTEYDLVESTMREFRRTGGEMPVRDKLGQCFSDVEKGDSILAVTRGSDEIGFWFNGTRVCTLSYPRIQPRFMGIFLGDNSRSRTFTRKLKGE